MLDWDVLDLPALTVPSLHSLLENEIAAISVPRFIDDSMREATLTKVVDAPDWEFYHGTAPPLGRLGITQYEHHDAKTAYLDAAPGASASRRVLLAPLRDPVDLVIDAFSAVWPGSVGVAKEAGRSYSSGVFRRGGGGVKIHADWGPRDGPGWTIAEITAQLAWNLHYSPPAVGGALVVYDYPWEPRLEASARQRFSDYDPATFASSRKITVAPQRGGLIVFNSRNAHAVEPAPEHDSRISVGSFIGLTPDRNLVFWA